MARVFFWLIYFLLVTGAQGRRQRTAFQHFFPDVRTELEQALAQNCSDLFHSYENEHVRVYGKFCVKTFSCVMQNIPEYTKANMASAAVLLGLAPWILSTLGSSTTEMSLLSSRRLILAALLVLSSPAMNPIKPFEYRNPIDEYLQRQRGQMLPSIPTRQLNILYVVVELLIVFANLANLSTLCWDLARKTIPVMSCDSDELSYLWVGLALITHILGIITFFTRARFPISEKRKGVRAWISRRAALVHEFSTCARSCNETKFELEWGDENWKFIISSWVAAIYTVAHLAFGTLVFSSLAFVGTSPCINVSMSFC